MIGSLHHYMMCMYMLAVANQSNALNAPIETRWWSLIHMCIVECLCLSIYISYITHWMGIWYVCFVFHSYCSMSFFLYWNIQLEIIHRRRKMEIKKVKLTTKKTLLLLSLKKILWNGYNGFIYLKKMKISDVYLNFK